jgi:hypothetical protein
LCTSNRLSGFQHDVRESSVSCSPSNSILIADAADLSVREIYLDHIFRRTNQANRHSKTLMWSAAHRRVKCPVSVLLDEAPHGLTRAYEMGGSDQPSPVAAIPFAASNGRYSTPLFIAGLRHGPADPAAASAAQHKIKTPAQPDDSDRFLRCRLEAKSSPRRSFGLAALALSLLPADFGNPSTPKF